MKTLKLFVVYAVIILCFCSCGFIKESDTYKDRLDDIQAISIVELGEYNSEGYRFSETLLCEISDITTFKKELCDIDCGNNWGDPQQLHIGDVVIKITYSNDDFDLIGWYAQLKNRSGNNNDGYMSFEQEQFESLIDKYLIE